MAHKWFKLHDRWDRLKESIRQSLMIKKHLRDKFIYKYVGKALFGPDLWSFRQSSIARGVAVGLFVAFTPTLGIQFIICTILMLIVRGNIPVAFMALMITNPATAVPIYYTEYIFGKEILSLFGIVLEANDPSSNSNLIATVTDASLATWVGGIVVATLAAIVSYTAIKIFGSIDRKLKFDKINYFRKLRKKGGDD